MPPMVARDAVEMSTGNHSPVGFSARLRSSSTMPGSTTQRRAGDIEVEDAVEMLRAVDDDRFVDGLPALRRSAAPRQHADAFRAANPYRPFGFLYRARRHYAEWHDLVVRGVGCITAAGEGVELHIADVLRPSAAVPGPA